MHSQPKRVGLQTAAGIHYRIGCGIRIAWDPHHAHKMLMFMLAAVGRQQSLPAVVLGKWGSATVVLGGGSGAWRQLPAAVLGG